MNEFKRKKVLEIVSDILEIPVERLNLDKPRKEYEEWDSLAHVQIVASVIDEFNISITLEDTAEINNIRELLELIGG